MKFPSPYIPALVGLVLVALVAWQLGGSLRKESPDLAAVAETQILAASTEPIQPIPQSVDLAPKKVALGKRLFADTQLSGPGTIACVTCHRLDKGSVDRRAFSLDVNGKPRSRNTLPVFNVALQTFFDWDGRFTSLESQALAVLEKSMATDWSVVLPRLDADAGYNEAFNAIYSDGITPENIVDAITTYEASLITPDSRFDRYLRGEKDAISADERRGYQLFTDYGCITCHQGVGIGGNMVAKFGVLRDYFADRGNITHADLGRYNISQRDIDRHRFKVPSLRNVALTAPYFHNASAKNLQEAVKTMAKYQLDRAIPDHEVDLIVRFLQTLTGELEGTPLWSN